jgi:hypothetical protein
LELCFNGNRVKIQFNRDIFGRLFLYDHSIF